MEVPAAVTALSDALEPLCWVSDLWVGGSLATGDYVPDVSDLDLVAVVDGPVDAGRVDRLTAVHEHLDSGPAAGANLGCVYVEEAALSDVSIAHTTWTHGYLAQRPLSLISRAELVQYGFALFDADHAGLLWPYRSSTCSLGVSSSGFVSTGWVTSRRMQRSLRFATSCLC